MTRNSLSIWQVSFRLWLTEKWKMRTSIKCRKTNTNVITTANENSRLQQANCLKRGKTRDQVASITNEIPVYFPHSIQNRSKTRCMFQTELEVVLSGFASHCGLLDFFRSYYVTCVRQVLSHFSWPLMVLENYFKGFHRSNKQHLLYQILKVIWHFYWMVFT